ncbi:homeobox protein vex1-like [Ambystoma mexicanum]|uniref:homeobox protein vex1-like n=1 Tax=Ambystoma mexicanum TaxID=8296 RepID=UPI0037E9C3A2
MYAAYTFSFLSHPGSEHRLPGTAPGCERRPASEKQRPDPRRNCEVNHGKWSWPQTEEEDPEGARTKSSTAGLPTSEKPRADQRRTCEASSGKRPWPQTDEEDPEGARPRTKFSTEQLQELERSFQEQRYIGVAEKRRLARELNLSELRIKTWFQNRRMKFKRQNQDARVEALFSGFILPYASYQEAITPDCIARNTFSVPTSPCSTAAVSGLPNVPLQSAHGPSGCQPISIPALGLCSYPATMLPLPFPGEYSSPRFHPYFPS